MIYFLTLADNKFTVQDYLDSWGRYLSPHIEVIAYEDLCRVRRLRTGTYIFTDHERFTSAHHQFAIELWDALIKAGPAARLLNDPRRVLGRLGLLKALHEQGINEFQAYKLSEEKSPRRFPVFLRSISDHYGSRTPLLRSQKEVDRAIGRMRLRDPFLRDSMMAEYCDTVGPDAIFRKYSAFYIGGEVTPRCLVFGRRWILKMADIIDAGKLAEERAYLEDNPHEDWIRRVFHLAGIDYGRIDYGLHNGVPQVWEINTAPMVMLLPRAYKPMHLKNQEWFSGRIGPVFSSLDQPAGSSRIPFRATPSAAFGVKVQSLRPRIVMQRIRGKLRRLIKGY